MSIGTNINSINMNAINQQYRFAFTDNSEPAPITESILTPDSKDKGDYSNISFENFNKLLLNVEHTNKKSGVVLGYNDQPKEIKELFSKIANGKYENFIKTNVDGFVFGRNLEKMGSNGQFSEYLGVSVGGDVSKEITDGAMDKLAFLDTYNYIFNQLETSSKGDELFTGFSQVLSVAANELHQSYNMSKGYIKEDEKSYQFLKEMFQDINKYLENGGSFNFVKKDEEGVFKEVITSMVNNLDQYITNLSSASDKLVFQFSATV
ncbi:MAG: hypothetical protein A2Y40_07025 [Candidatus Margulisbacteria bacterium GWF2_35_9]|nr:MAG: hypothetical protein A2Y40_07025 [Candidatus Margulisbacteria bacterium GWF2_35_9]